MARWWNNQYYQNPEIAGIRKTLGDSMIGSYARDVGDLRGMLNAEKTVEQVMRNKAAQGLAAQGPVLGGRIATAMGVKDPQADFLEAVAKDYAWRKNRHDAAQAGAILGRTELQHALLGSKTGAADALAGQRERAGAYDAARTSRITEQDQFVQAMLNDQAQVSSYLRSIGQPPTSDPVRNRTLAGLILLAPNRAQAADALNTLQLTDQQKQLVAAKIVTEGSKQRAAESLGGLRDAKAKDVGGDEDLGFEEAPVEIVTDWWGDGVDDFDIPRSLYTELATEPVAQWNSDQREAAINMLIKEGYTRLKAKAILKFVTEEQTGD